ncbi:10301_t:CDS:10 [Ambispora gerdemannii]|uniref:10301_t:CDS:1 n=1 Tax=Ambispora gerdemannii TaxID=144530 RepID=A0A9N8VA01_9GLOM|nr:10301_t:CDS:10 [Ambispora gerdemannii]
MSASGYLVAGLLEKMDSLDTDFRYMATNDLMNELQKDVFTLEEPTEKKVVNKILELMNDPNGEVQNLAVKCLGPLVKKVREPQLQDIIDKLCDYTSEGKDELRDIAGIGLKTVIVEIPSNSPVANNVLQRLIPRLLSSLETKSATYEVQMDTLDSLSEILARFGTLVANNPDTQKRIQDVLVPLLSHPRPAFRKRTTVALGNLVAHTQDELFNDLVKKLLTEFNKSSNQHDKLKTLIQCVGTLSRSSAPRLGKYLPQFLPLVINNVHVNDDELRENCLQHSLFNILIGESRDYSDDDDISWKVRRSSSKLLAAIIGTRHELLSQLYQDVAPALVNRFKEREESVRVDIFQTFIVLLRQTLVYGGENYTSRNTNDAKKIKVNAELESGTSPKQLLRGLISKLSRNLSKQLLSKSISTKQTGFSLLRELVTVLNGGLENHIQSFIPAIENSLSVNSDSGHHHSGTNSNLKIETLTFLRQFFKVHQPHVFHKHLSRLCPPIINSVNDKFYKITSEAFLVCIELIKVIRPIEYSAATKTYNYQPLDPILQKYILEIYSVTISRLKTLDVDQEVKERSILCLGVLLSQTGDSLKPQLPQCMPLLLERLRNEVTRLTTVKTFTSIADSPVCVDPQVTKTVLKAVDEVALLLRKSQRQLKVASLICLEVFIRRYGSQFNQQTYIRLYSELTPHISDQDLHLLPLALNNVVAILIANPDNIIAVNRDVVPTVFDLVQSSIVQGAALDSLISLFVTLIKTKESEFIKLLSGLMKPAIALEPNFLTLSKQSYSTIAQCIAALCLSSPRNLGLTAAEFTRKIEDQSNDSIKYLSLLTLGEIGRKVDLANQGDKLHKTILSLFSAPSEEVKSAAAFALGNVAVGNVNKYLPIVIQEIIRSDPKKRYLLLHALKEIITRYSNDAGVKTLGPFADETWNILFDSGEVVEEGTRNVVAECKRLRHSSAQTRGTVVTAIKYTFTNQGQQYDELLRPLIVDFLSLIKDNDLNVRRLSLSTLNSAAHSKPYLIRDVLDQLLPLLYEETVIKEHLIHMVEMGPFKHKVDDGLDLRKSAFECMSTLLDTCRDKLDIFRFLDRVLAGLTDVHDIAMLSHTMLIRLTEVAPTAVMQKMDEAVEPLKATLAYKLKENAIKSEIEKQQELVRSALRVTAIWAPLSEQGSTPKFDSWLREIKSGTHADTYRAVEAEVENKDYSYGHGGDASMDLS